MIREISKGDHFVEITNEAELESNHSWSSFDNQANCSHGFCTRSYKCRARRFQMANIYAKIPLQLCDELS